MASSSPSADGRHLVLVGMMGSGKTTVGRALAAALGRPFVDLDERVEAAAGRTVAELFAGEGEESFRDRETEALADTLKALDPTVIAAGGGVVLREDNRTRLADARVIWLRARPEILLGRVSGKSGRPLLAPEPTEERLAALTGERADLYRKVAMAVVDVDGRSVDQVVQQVLKVLA